MQYIGIISLLIATFLIGWWFVSTGQVVTPPGYVSPEVEEALDPAIAEHIAEKADLIQVTMPKPGSFIGSPLTVTGKARGTWYFEGSFPIILTNWNGLIIAEGYATAEGEWMTEEFVPFVATIIFSSPYEAGDPKFMQPGSLILQKSNPSGSSRYDDALELPVVYASLEQTVPTRDATPSYDEVMDAARGAARSMER